MTRSRFIPRALAALLAALMASGCASTPRLVTGTGSGGGGEIYDPTSPLGILQAEDGPLCVGLDVENTVLCHHGRIVELRNYVIDLEGGLIECGNLVTKALDQASADVRACAKGWESERKFLKAARDEYAAELAQCQAGNCKESWFGKWGGYATAAGIVLGVFAGGAAALYATGGGR